MGILRRAVIVMDENFEPSELVNPEIIAQEGSRTAWRAVCPSPACGAMSSARSG